MGDAPDTPPTSTPNIAAILETVHWAIKERFSLTSEWMEQAEATQRMLTEAIVGLGAKIERLIDRMGVLEDLEARATELMGDNSPPPVAKPTHTVKPKHQVRRAA